MKCVEMLPRCSTSIGYALRLCMTSCWQCRHQRRQYEIIRVLLGLPCTFWFARKKILGHHPSWQHQYNEGEDVVDKNQEKCKKILLGQRSGNGEPHSYLSIDYKLITVLSSTLLPSYNLNGPRRSSAAQGKQLKVMRLPQKLSLQLKITKNRELEMWCADLKSPSYSSRLQRTGTLKSLEAWSL